MSAFSFFVQKKILSIIDFYLQVSNTHSRMEKDFGLINKTVEFLKKYQHELSVDANQLYQNTPIRWNNLKTKISLAKQNLGPTIQEESPSILKVIIIIIIIIIIILILVSLSHQHYLVVFLWILSDS